MIQEVCERAEPVIKARQANINRFIHFNKFDIHASTSRSSPITSTSSVMWCPTSVEQPIVNDEIIFDHVEVRFNSHHQQACDPMSYVDSSAFDETYNNPYNPYNPDPDENIEYSIRQWEFFSAGIEYESSTDEE